MPDKLTKKLIENTSYIGDSKEKYIRWDTEISGFGVRLYPSGKKSFILSYRQDGTKRLYTIGQYGNITLEQARELARKKMGEVADGKDPLLVRKARKKKNEWTVEKAFKDFLKKYAQTHTKTWRETKRIFEKDVLPAIGRKPIDEIKKDDILKILNTIVDRNSGFMANKTLDAISSFLNWCVQRGLIEHSPAYQIKAPTRKRSRDRVLSDYELKEIWEACDTFNYPFGPLMHFLILTGQRRGEVAAMRWEDYDKEKKLWTLPRESTKSDRRHEVPLSDMAIEILENAPNLGEYIFTNSGDYPFANFSRDKRELDSKLKALRAEDNQPPMPKWRIHDLRRTCASGMAGLEVFPHVVEKILNHTSGTISGVAAIYNRYQYAGEMRAALNLWDQNIRKILELEPSKSVIRIPKKKK